MTRPEWIKPIEDQAGGLPVLLVEGKDDVGFFDHFFDQHSPGWRRRFRIEAAGNKRRVIQGVKHHRPDWLGIVDRDEYTPAEFEADVAGCARVQALPRFCIESYLCDPAEIWAVLPPNQRARVQNDPTQLSNPIYGVLTDWVHHGAMWRVLRKLYQENRIPEELDRAPVTDENEIRRILENWHQRLAPDQVLAQYHQELHKALALSTDQQLREYVHGKKFYRQVVLQRLDHLFSGRGLDDWWTRFSRAKMGPPADLQPLLDWVLAQFP